MSLGKFTQTRNSAVKMKGRLPYGPVEHCGSYGVANIYSGREKKYIYGHDTKARNKINETLLRNM